MISWLVTSRSHDIILVYFSGLSNRIFSHWRLEPVYLSTTCSQSFSWLNLNPSLNKFSTRQTGYIIITFPRKRTLAFNANFPLPVFSLRDNLHETSKLVLWKIFVKCQSLFSWKIRRKFTWKVKACFLGKIWNIIWKDSWNLYPACWALTLQNAHIKNRKIIVAY